MVHLENSIQFSFSGILIMVFKKIVKASLYCTGLEGDGFGKVERAAVRDDRLCQIFYEASERAHSSPSSVAFAPGNSYHETN